MAFNKIRKELIPLLRKINPAVVEVLFRLADIAREQEDFLERETEKYWKRCAPPLTGGVVRMPRQVFIDSPAAVRQALIRRAVLDLTHTTKDLAYRHVDQVMEFLEHPTHSRRMDLALGVDVSMENDWIVFRRRSELADLPDWEGMAIPCPGRLLIRCPTWTITVSFPQSSTPTPSGKEPDPWTAWIDPERIRMPLYIRKRKTGEKFFPQGMPGPVSLSAFLSSHHMPFSERDLWPLVCDADGIIWIPGYRIKNGVSPVKETYRCMKIEVDPSC